jgi:zinc transport system substrate-binding protein
MKRKKQLVIFQVVLLVIVSLVHLTATTPRLGLRKTEKIQAIATVFPLMEFTQAVLGDRGEVALLLPPGAEIHSWQPRPSDIRRLSQSDLFVCIGADLEPWVDNILKSVNKPDLHVFRASEGLALNKGEEHEHEHEHEHEDRQEHDQDHEHDHGSLDPHIWLDFGLDKVIIDRLIEKMSELLPEASAYFRANGERYKKRLHQLDQRFDEILSRCKQKVFIMGGHAAFGYLAKRYHLQQISLYGLNPESTPTPRELVKVVELAKEHDIKVIYFEIYVSDELAKVIAREIGARILVLSPAANLTRSQIQKGTTFFDIMSMNLKNLQEGLDCE